MRATGRNSGTGIFAATCTVTNANVTANSPEGNGVLIDGSCTISGSVVNATTDNGSGGSPAFYADDLAVTNASAVSGNAKDSGNYGVYCCKLSVTGGSSVTGTAGVGIGVLVMDTPSQSATLTVSGPGSYVHGKGSIAGIMAQGPITGVVTSPAGGVVGQYDIGGTLYNAVFAARGDANPAQDATLSVAVADVPKTGDKAPLALLCNLILLCGAGLAVSAILRRRKRA